MENEMIERAVKAVMAIELASAFPGTHLSRDGARKVVLAAVEAMRDPTGAMIKAADDANADYRLINLNSHAHLGPEGVFRAMIDAALTPSPRNPR